MSTTNSAWDHGLDWDSVYDRLRKEIVSKDKEYQDFKKPEKMAKVAILFIACRNGSRLTEAINAYNAFLKSKAREVSIKVEKRKAKNAYFRLMVIPDEIPESLPAYTDTKENVSMFCKTHFKYNPHSLRYAFITKLSKQGIAPQVISKITGHASLNMILNYTSDKTAQSVLKNLESG